MGLPLQGLRVIDLILDLAGPFCTMILSDLGAGVIEIGKPDGGDENRSLGASMDQGTSYDSRRSTVETRVPLVAQNWNQSFLLPEKSRNLSFCLFQGLVHFVQFDHNFLLYR